MTRGQIDVWLVRRVTPNVITHRRVHVLTRSVEIFFVAFDLVDESSFRDRDGNFILLPARFGWRRGGFAAEGAHMTEGLLPPVSMRRAKPKSQFSPLLFG